MGEERESEEGRSARGKTSGGEGSGRRDDILSWQGREGGREGEVEVEREVSRVCCSWYVTSNNKRYET
jgi:hypothetical protein